MDKTGSNDSCDKHHYAKGESPDARRDSTAKPAKENDVGDRERVKRWAVPRGQCAARND
jgi:hypothetical protein